VRVLGHDTRLNGPRDLARSVGFVFQDPEAQMVTDQVEDEIVFGMENLGIDQRTMRIRLEETLDLLGVNHLRYRDVATLSGGERQRVAIAAALVTRPEVLVLDEPTSQLDPLAAHDILAAVERLNSDLGMTIVIAEHRLDRVLPFAERIVAMQQGEAIEGPVQEILPSLDDVPPLVTFARWAGWEPVPLTIRDARRRLAGKATRPHVRQVQPTVGTERVRLEGVTHRYDATPTLSDIDLTAHAGEVIAVIGRNGSGKTTLLKHLNGLLRPQHGRVLLNGDDISRRPVHEIGRDVGYVPQHPTAILHQETLCDELAFTARAHGRTVDPLPLLRQLGIAAHIDRHPLDLSGGERQRAALAAIAITQPSVLLLDEPTRGLPGHDKQMLAQFVRDYAAAGRLVLIATHDVEFVATAASRALMLAEGELIADGTPADVLSGSLAFATQMNRLFGGRVQTLGDATTAFGAS
jgi:energy-coupling factor transport system ATP-binding protein